MEPIWFKPDLSEEIQKNNDIFDQTHNVITDIVSGRLDITQLVENMGGVLTNKEVESREKGMRFYTKILKEIPKDYLTEMHLKFISKFYTDRLKDNHRVIPAVLEGYLYIVDMKHYIVQSSGEYFVALFREVACQSQVRQDRYNIYLTIQKLLDRDADYMKTLGPDFVYGVISSIDGERDPRNLLFLFNLLPKFLAKIPLGHLVEEMFEVISCYYPIDFHPSPNDPAAVSRGDLAQALCPCLCATPEFAEHCLVLLVEKLDSQLRVAKIDSLMLLAESCKTFKADSYGPFLKALWSSIHREMTHKTDEELKMAAHEALSALLTKLATTSKTDQNFENFMKGILISMQTSIAQATTVINFVQATKILLTAANTSKESCEIITKSMIPAVIAYYEFKTTPKLQIASLDFLADLYEMAKHWSVLDEVENQVNEIPQMCLKAVSETSKEYQITGFKTLIRVINALKADLVVPFVEILIYNIQNAQDDQLLAISVDCVHAIGRKYPELIMNLVVKGKCDIDNLTSDKIAFQKRLNLLSSLASIDDFTKIIIEEMLKAIKVDEEAGKIVTALNTSISNSSMYSNDKIGQIESDHGLIESILNWLFKEIERMSHDSLEHGFTLISNTMYSLKTEKQLKILNNKTKDVLEKCKDNDSYFQILECLYRSIDQKIYTTYFEDTMTLGLNLSLNSEKDIVRLKACCLVGHFLNKAESGQKFEVLYEILKNYLTSISQEEVKFTRLVQLYGWIAKALIMRGSDLFQFWLNKILISISNPESSASGSQAIQTIMTDHPNYLNSKTNCRTSLLYKQRIFQAFSKLSEKFETNTLEVKEAYCLSWAYVLEKTPKSVLNSEVDKITPLLVDALEYDNKDLLIVMIGVLIHFVQGKNVSIAQSLQTILPRLINLTTYVKSMDVRIKSLECLYEIANSYTTRLLVPYKQDILIDLAASLDDSKRLVRSEAVKARTRWFLVGAPGETKEN